MPRFSGDKWDENAADYGDPIRPHPLFPLPEDQDETRRIARIRFYRKELDGRIKTYPEALPADDFLEGWKSVVQRWGGGTYRAIGTSSLHKIQGYSKDVTGNDWIVLDGAPRPFALEGTTAPTAPPAPAAGPESGTSAPPAPSAQGGMWSIMQAQMAQNHQLLLELIKSRQPDPKTSSTQEVIALVREVMALVPPKADSATGSTTGLVQAAADLRALGVQVGAPAAPADTLETNLIGDLIKTAKDVALKAQGAPTQPTPPPAQLPPRPTTISVTLKDIGTVQMEPDDFAAFIAKRGRPTHDAPPELPKVLEGVTAALQMLAQRISTLEKRSASAEEDDDEAPKQRPRRRHAPPRAPERPLESATAQPTTAAEKRPESATAQPTTTAAETRPESAADRPTWTTATTPEPPATTAAERPLESAGDQHPTNAEPRSTTPHPPPPALELEASTAAAPTRDEVFALLPADLQATLLKLQGDPELQAAFFTPEVQSMMTPDVSSIILGG